MCLGARAIVLAGRLLNSLRSEERNSPPTFVRPIPAKMPAKRTAGVNFCLCFQCVAKSFPRNPESNQCLKLLLLLVFLPWCPWPAVAHSRNHLNLRSFYPSIAADTSQKYQQVDARH
jgi:hypothetical protein